MRITKTFVTLALCAATASPMVYADHKTPAATPKAGAQPAVAVKTTATLAALKASRVIPDVIDEFTPTVDLGVSYGAAPLPLGATVDPADVARPPKITLGGAKPDGLYTLVMTDPGVMDPTAMRAAGESAWQWLHYIVVNIPGDGTIEDGKVIEPYGPPAPPAGTHRYSFILFEEDKNIAPATPADRGNWNTREFAEANALEPVGGFYFNAQPAT